MRPIYCGLILACGPPRISLESTPSDLFRWPIRVYFEDTDAAGIVYYANYLKFFERTRTEWLRELGLQQASMVKELGLQFVVVHASIDYVLPARLDDELTIDAGISRLARASLSFVQRAWRGKELLARAHVKVACVDTVGLAPRALPSLLVEKLRFIEQPVTGTP